MKKTIQLKTGFKTNIYKWDIPNPKGIIQIIHGSAEHASKYENFAKWLNKKGISVWSIDLRGHGELESKRDNLGYFGKKGHLKVLDDIHEVTQMIKKDHPNIPYTLLGHSMGSFVARTYSIKFGGIDNLIIVGTNHLSKWKSFGGLLLAKFTSLFFSKKHKATFLDKLSYKSFNKPFKQEKDVIAWLSKSLKPREEFLKDELSGFNFTNKGFVTMMKWVNFINSKRNIKKTNKEINILFLAGKEDPVGSMSKDVSKAFKIYFKFGYKAKIKLYEDMRHEILNENEKTKVYNDILDFISKSK